MLQNTEGCLSYFIKFNSCYGCCLERGNEEVEEHFAYFLCFVTFDVAGAKKCSEESKNYDYYDNIVSTTHHETKP